MYDSPSAPASEGNNIEISEFELTPGTAKLNALAIIVKLSITNSGNKKNPSVLAEILDKTNEPMQTTAHINSPA